MRDFILLDYLRRVSFLFRNSSRASFARRWHCQLASRPFVRSPGQPFFCYPRIFISQYADMLISYSRRTHPHSPVYQPSPWYVPFPACIATPAHPCPAHIALPAVYDLPTSDSTPNSATTPFENSPEVLVHLLRLDDSYKSGHATSSTPLTMSDSRSIGSTSEQGRHPRGRGMSQFGQSRRPPPRPFQTPSAPLYPPSLPTSQENRPSTSAAAPPFQGPPPPQYTYGQRGAYVGQYTMSGQPSVGMAQHSQPQYVYHPPHPGLHAPDQSMLSPPQSQSMAYPSSNPFAMMQTHSPVYQFPGHSPEGSSSSSHSHSFPNSPGYFSAHAPSQAHSSPPPLSPLVPPSSAPPHIIPTPPQPASYTGQTPYSPMRYSTPPFAYPPHSFAPSPSLYASQYASHYLQPYSQPSPEQDSQGTWYYFPPQSGQYESFQRPYAMSFSSANTREIEPSQYGQVGTSPGTSTIFPMSPAHAMGPSPGPSTSSQTQAAYSPVAPSPQLFSYRQGAPENLPPPLQRGTPPDPTPPPISPSIASSPPSADHLAPRRPHHPNPPAHRSEWVMWAGNVPSDATHDELWWFFNSPPTSGSSSNTQSAQSTQSTPTSPVGSSTTGSAASTESVYGGVSSIFLISRSNCAFINFQTDTHLHAAIRHFNGVPLRSSDLRCPRLVCRVRGREDDLKAGVGGQRGAGMHVRWVKDKKMREREATRGRSASMSSEQVTTPSSSPTDPVHMIAGLSLSSDEEGGQGRRVRRPEPHSSSSGSYASTNSSILTAYFPKRYFILKSLTQVNMSPLTFRLWLY